jgi:hypothetical protein
MSLSPLTPYQFVVAGEAPYVRNSCRSLGIAENDLIYRDTFSIEGKWAVFSKKNGEWCLGLEKMN